MTVMQVPFDTLENDPGLLAIMESYALESSLKDMPPIAPNWDFYRSASALGMLRTFVAYDDSSALAGFALMLCAIVPHYSQIIATLESFYVHPAQRSTGAALRLLRLAENTAREIGAVGFFVSAPNAGKLAEVMQKMKGYKETNRVFFRSLAA